jgi:hypothetical protein
MTDIVAYWHLAEVGVLSNVRFAPTADIRQQTFVDRMLWNITMPQRSLHAPHEPLVFAENGGIKRKEAPNAVHRDSA